MAEIPGLDILIGLVQMGFYLVAFIALLRIWHHAARIANAMEGKRQDGRSS